jgi:hypothetical protein
VLPVRVVSRLDRPPALTPAESADLARRGRRSWTRYPPDDRRLGSRRALLGNQSDPNNDRAVVEDPAEIANDGSTSTDQMLEDADGAVAASTHDQPAT